MQNRTEVFGVGGLPLAFRLFCECLSMYICVGVPAFWNISIALESGKGYLGVHRTGTASERGKVSRADGTTQLTSPQHSDLELLTCMSQPKKRSRIIRKRIWPNKAED